MATDPKIIFDTDWSPALRYSRHKKAWVPSGDRSQHFDITDLANGCVSLGYNELDGHSGGTTVNALDFEKAVRAWLATR